MSRYCKQSVALLTLAAAVVLWCAPAALAKPPGGGGGVVYFNYDNDLYTMNDDGSGMAVVAGFPADFSPWGEPSRQMHAGKRWFPEWVSDLGNVYPNGDQGQQLVALSDTGDVVPLSIEPDLQQLDFHPRWRVGDNSLSWIGRRWDGTGAVLEGGLYTTELVLDAGGNVTGAGSSQLLVSIPLVDGVEPDIRGHDWSPDGTQFVYETRGGEIVIADPLTGTFDEIVSGGSVWNPFWSPAGDKLMVEYETRGRSAVGIMYIDGSGLKLVEAGGPSWGIADGVWSPTGSHLVYKHRDYYYQDSYIARATSDGRGKKRLTDDSLAAGALKYPVPIGWRDVPASASASVPEPSSLLFSVLAFVGMLLRRRSLHQSLDGGLEP